MTIFRKGLLTAALLAFAGGMAQAATITACNDASLPIDVSSNVTPNIGCEVIFLGSGSDNATAISGMFGETMWTQLGKVDPPPGSTTGGELTLSSNGTDDPLIAGDWSVTAALLASYGKVMLMFKAGADHNSAPSATVGYLINATSGSYSSPIYNSKTGNQRGISHVTLYVADRVPAIPLPASGLLLLGALGGLGLMRRRRPG